MSLTHTQEIKKGQRFSFGENWALFLRTVDESSVTKAQASLTELLPAPSFKNKTFLDIGSGSGLSSLAARRLGATITSFDFDPESVECTKALKLSFARDDTQWHIEEGSILDLDTSKRLGKFDIVYSWGVLHHTGHMWMAIENAGHMTKPDGYLILALYNNQGWKSRLWKWIKKTYVILPSFLKWLVLYPCAVRLWGPTHLKDFFRGKPFHTWRTYKSQRGMSPWRDVVDWVGGYPFEVASREEVIDRLAGQGFTHMKVKSVGKGHGCNEFVFRKTSNS